MSQNQKAVTAYFSSKELLLFGFAELYAQVRTISLLGTMRVCLPQPEE